MEQTPSCKYFRLLADEYIEGELTTEEMREFEAHIAECPACRKEFLELRALKEMLAESDEEIPEGLHERIMNAVSGEIKPRKSRLRVLRRAVISAACAVICLSLTVAFTLMPLWKEGTGSGLPEDPIADSAADKTEFLPSDTQPSHNQSADTTITETDTPDQIGNTGESTATPGDPEITSALEVVVPESTFAAAESTADGKIPDTHPETAKPETEVPIAETESPAATEAEAIETPTKAESATDEAPENTSALLLPDAYPEVNTELGGEEITLALLIVSGLLAVASFIAFLISLSSVRNIPSKKNGEEK